MIRPKKLVPLCLMIAASCASRSSDHQVHTTDKVPVVAAKASLSKQIESLSRQVLGSRKGQPIYLVGDGEQGINRIGGVPLGVTKKTWPSFGNTPMEHLFTIDLDTAPLVRARLTEVQGDVRAVALFVSSAEDNQAFAPRNAETKMVVLTNADIALGAMAQPLAAPRELGTFKLTTVHIPKEVFDVSGEPQSKITNEIRSKLYGARGFLLGEPIWLQSAEHTGDFVMQFDETMVDINLGDMGVMYVFSDTQFWQCL